MEKKYYIIIDGSQQGPFTIEELCRYNLNAESYVWREGLENWVKAATLPELAAYIGMGQPQSNPQADQQPGQPPYTQLGQPPYTQPGYQQPGYQQPGYRQPYDNAPIQHTNWLPWAIVATVLGFCTSCIGVVLGVIGIVYANKANEYYDRGNRIEGDSANKTASTCTIIGLVLVVIGVFGSIAMVQSGLLGTYIDLLNNID